MDPKEARRILNSSTETTFIDERDKLSSFKMESGRELALIEENKQKVSLYVEVYPCFMPEVIVEEEYIPQPKNVGRHSNLHYITSKLGFENRAYRLHIKTEEVLELFLNWYKYA